MTTAFHKLHKFIDLYELKYSATIYLYVILLLCLNTNAQFDNNDYLKREHSLVKPYQGTGVAMPFWDFLGNTMVTNNHIRLTADLQSRNGALWNQVPCMSRNWEIHVNFKVSGKGKDLFGDGIALWYVRDRMMGGPVFGSRDYFSGLAIMLDTYSNQNGPHNHQHPYISAMISNGTFHYDHDLDGTHTQLAGCEAKFRNVDFDTIISIRYENDALIVSTDMENRGQWKNCFTVSNVQLPTGYYFGASATTGDLSDNHDILSIKFYELEVPDDGHSSQERMKIIPNAQTFEPPRERVNDKKPQMSNVKIFFIILFGMVVAVCAAIGCKYMYDQKQRSKKRLY